MKNWISGDDYPSFMTENSLKMLDGGYLLKGETPNGAIRRVAKAVGDSYERRCPEYFNSELLQKKILAQVEMGNFGFSSPIWANMGTTRGLPISCFGTYVGDNMPSIAKSVSETMTMSANGGGTSAYVGDIRAEGETVRENGIADGLKMPIGFYEKVVVDIRQGEFRKGAMAVYTGLSHGDFYTFMDMKSHSSDIKQLNMGICVTDDEIARMKAGDQELRKRWALLLKVRAERGMPYIIFIDNANNQRPDWYKRLGMTIKASNLCTEIMLPSDELSSFVCCLLPLNLANFDKWDDETVRMAVFVLDAVMEDFIQKTADIPNMERARKFAIEHRALGLGTMGWHTFLQEKNVPFTGLLADSYTRKIYSKIKEDAESASDYLGEILGEPLVCAGTGRRNATLVAPAPNVSSATIWGEISQGIDAFIGNFVVYKKSKMTYSFKNPTLIKLLESKGKNTREVWDIILKSGGSVQTLDFLSDDERKVFETFAEMNQMEIVKQAALRQKYIDQAQSLNLNFPPSTPPIEINKVILKAHELGLKSLYYQKSQTPLRENMNLTTDEDCVSCDG